jgi:hypothetical protein
MKRVAGALIVVAVLAGSAHAEIESGQPSLSLDDVLSAWQRRAANVRSARFAWRETRTVTKGAYLNPDMPEQINPKRVYDPPEDRTVTTLHEMAFDRDRIVYRWWNAEEPDERTENALDHGTHVRFSGTAARTNDAYPNASIRPDDKFDDRDAGQVSGVLWPYRLLDPAMGKINPEALKLTSRTGVIDGHNCVIVERTFSTPDRVEEYWVAPEMDFLLLRYRTANRGMTRIAIDFSYRRDAVLGWIPDEWRGTFAKEQGVVYSHTSKVTDAEVNSALPASDFEVVFPPGTLVADLFSGESFLMRENGEKRYLTAAEAAATYEQLASSETGRALDAPTQPRRKWIRYAILACIVVVACLLVVYRVRTRRKSRA